MENADFPSCKIERLHYINCHPSGLLIVDSWVKVCLVISIRHCILGLTQPDISRSHISQQVMRNAFNRLLY